MLTSAIFFPFRLYLLSRSARIRGKIGRGEANAGAGSFKTFEGGVSIREIDGVRRKLDRFNRFLRGDSRDKATADFFGEEV